MRVPDQIPIPSPIFAALENVGLDPAVARVEGGREHQIDFPRVYGDPMPLGAVLATARLTAVIPMHTGDCAGGDHYLYLGEPAGNLVSFDRTEPPHVGGYWQNTDVTDQLPYGNFAAGRWALLLDDIVKLDKPTPARGRQGLWTWDETTA